MTPRRYRRLAAVLLVLIGVGLAAALGLKAFRKNLLYYYTPSQVAAGEAHAGQVIRMGGLVARGSVKRAPGSDTVRFVVTDMRHYVPVACQCILPDLFAEGQGVVVQGALATDGLFAADNVLAKHDEKYMPPEVTAAIKQAEAQAAAQAASGR